MPAANYAKSTFFEVDAYDMGVGEKQKMHPVAYFSHKHSSAE